MKHTAALFFVLSIFFNFTSSYADTTLPVNETISSNEAAFAISNTGLGGSGIFTIDNPNNEKIALGALTNGRTAIGGVNIGDGVAGVFANLENTNNSGALLGLTLGLGTTGAFLSANENNVEPTLMVGNAGLNAAAQIFTLNDTSFQPALEVSYNGLGNAITVINQKSGAALQASIQGNGSAIHATVEGTSGNYGIITTVVDSASSAHAIAAHNSGMGSAGRFQVGNVNSSSTALLSFTRGKGQGITAASLGGGDGVFGVIPQEAAEPTGNFTTIDGVRAAVRGITAAEKGNAGVFIVENNSNFNPAVWARHDGSGAALYAENTAGGRSILATGDMRLYGQGEFWRHASEGAALRAFSYWESGPVARFIGDVSVDGTVHKTGGGFKIDHPLDPKNKYLYHSFVESPEMMNVYDGVARLDANGEAWVKLPAYFDALNKDFRYQLTPIGAPGPNLHIAKEIENNRFLIAGGTSGMKVSWQITGVRNDHYAQKNRIIPEVEKEVKNRGKYIHPNVFGKPVSEGIGWDERSEDIKKQQALQQATRKKLTAQRSWEVVKKSIEVENALIKKLGADQKKLKSVGLSKLKGKMDQAINDVNQTVRNLK
jgi:hypothetical protein